VIDQFRAFLSQLGRSSVLFRFSFWVGLVIPPAECLLENMLSPVKSSQDIVSNSLNLVFTAAVFVSGVVFPVVSRARAVLFFVDLPLL
jgi:hypothetical protein